MSWVCGLFAFEVGRVASLLFYFCGRGFPHFFPLPTYCSYTEGISIHSIDYWIFEIIEKNEHILSPLQIEKKKIKKVKEPPLRYKKKWFLDLKWYFLREITRKDDTRRPFVKIIILSFAIVSLPIPLFKKCWCQLTLSFWKFHVNYNIPFRVWNINKIFVKDVLFFYKRSRRGRRINRALWKIWKHSRR